MPPRATKKTTPAPKPAATTRTRSANTKNNKNAAVAASASVTEDAAVAAVATNNNQNQNQLDMMIIDLPEEELINVGSTTTTTTTTTTNDDDASNTINPSSTSNSNNNNNHRRRDRSPEKQKVDASIFSSLMSMITGKSNNDEKKDEKNDDDAVVEGETSTAAATTEVENIDDDDSDDEDEPRRNNNYDDYYDNDNENEKNDQNPDAREDFENAAEIDMITLLSKGKNTNNNNNKKASAGKNTLITAAARDQIVIAEFERIAGLRAPKTILGNNNKEKKITTRKKKNENNNNNNGSGSDDDDNDENNNNAQQPPPPPQQQQQQEQVPAIRVPQEYTDRNFDRAYSNNFWFLLNSAKIFREPLKTAPTVPIDAIAAPVASCPHGNGGSCTCLLYLSGFQLDGASSDASARHLATLRQAIHRGLRNGEVQLYGPFERKRNDTTVATDVTIHEFLTQGKWADYNQTALRKVDPPAAAKAELLLTGGRGVVKINDTSRFDPNNINRFLEARVGGSNIVVRSVPRNYQIKSAAEETAELPKFLQIADSVGEFRFSYENLSTFPAHYYGSIPLVLDMTLNPEHVTSAVHAAHHLRFALEMTTEPHPPPFVRDGPLTIAQQRLERQRQGPTYVVPFDFLPPQNLAQKMSPLEAAKIATLFLRAKKLDSRFLLSIDWNDELLLETFKNRFIDNPDALPLQWPLGLAPRDHFIVNRMVRFLNAEQTLKITVPKGQQTARDALAASPIPDQLFPASSKFRLPPNLKLQQHQKETIAFMRQMEAQGSDSFLHVRLPKSDNVVHLSPLLSTFFATRPAHGKLHQLLEKRDLNNFRRGGILASTVGMGKTLMVVALALLDVADNAAKSPEDPTKFPFITDKSCRCFVQLAGANKKPFIDAACTTTETENAELGFDLYKKNRHVQLAVSCSLILCPVTLVKQWKSEIEKFFPSANVIIYHASGSRHQITYDQIAAADFLITSYELYKNQMKKEAAQVMSSGWCFSPIVYSSPSCFNNAFGSKTKIITQLSRIRFRRVIFDEFHKNGGLDSMNLSTDLVECDFMWAVSGTPLHPSLWGSGFINHLIAPIPIVEKYKAQLENAFSPIKTSLYADFVGPKLFQHEKFRSSLLPSNLGSAYVRVDRELAFDGFLSSCFRGIFTPNQAKDPSTSRLDHLFFTRDTTDDFAGQWQRLCGSHCVVNYQVLSFLAKFMIRHTERDSAELSNIQVTEKIVNVSLSKKEYDRYCETLELIKTEFRSLVARGRVNTRILRVIGLLNKLRHAACDPLAVTVSVANALQFEGGTQFDNENARHSIVTIPARIFGGLVFPGFANSKHFSLADHPHLQQDLTENGKDYAFVKNFAAIESLREDLEGFLDEEPLLATCCLCAGDIAQPVIAKCGHGFCRECTLEFAKHQAQGGPNAKLCPLCRAVTMSDNDKKVLLSFPAPPAPAVAAEDQEEGKTNNDDEDAAAAEIPMSQQPIIVPPKVRAVVRLMQEVLAKDPSAKFVIFTVYVAQALREEFARLGIQSVYIDGATSMEHRGRCVEQFQNPSSTMRAFILNTRIANCGLTLTAATHMIIVDPSISSAVDMQMLGRIRRIGQKSKEVFVHRLISRGTVEEPLRLAVAEQSLSLAGGKTEEQKSKSIELMRTFFEHAIDPNSIEKEDAAAAVGGAVASDDEEEVHQDEDGQNQDDAAPEEEEDDDNNDNNNDNKKNAGRGRAPRAQKATANKKPAAKKAAKPNPKKAKVAKKKVPATKAAGKKKK